MFGLVVHLQRADAGGEVDYARQGFGFQGLHQGVATETQHQVQLGGADFQEQVGVAREASDQAGVVLADVQDDGGLDCL
ncbi:hypothetical protein D3C86_1936410 [compost metagenome]